MLSASRPGFTTLNNLEVLPLLQLTYGTCRDGPDLTLGHASRPIPLLVEVFIDDVVIAVVVSLGLLLSRPVPGFRWAQLVSLILYRLVSTAFTASNIRCRFVSLPLLYDFLIWPCMSFFAPRLFLTPLLLALDRVSSITSRILKSVT